MKSVKIVFGLLYLFVQSTVSEAHNTDSLILKIMYDEYWWGGLSAQGNKMPYDSSANLTIDLWGNNQGNQAQPLLISSKGRYVWSEKPFEYSFEKGELSVWSRNGKIVSGKAGKNLKDAFQFASKTFFPSNGKLPDKLLFSKPQFNTWIELQYNQNEKDILQYAHSIVENGYPTGVLMLDDTWQENYGVWDFAPRNFKDPKGMIDELHAMGFKVMLWVCPFVSPDSKEFRYLSQKRMLLLDDAGSFDVGRANTKSQPAIIRWWNGASACLDLSNPEATAWFKERLDFLQSTYGVDGFKFDAGDAGFYADAVTSFEQGTPNDQTTYFARVGLDYPLNEYRASWKMAGLPLAQRLRDKNHSWDDLQKLIPDMMSASLLGYAYTCPDMIGGGEYTSFSATAKIDQELVVRSAQVHALMPMMQFSVAPWRVLSNENAQLCLAAAKLHKEMGDFILRLAKQSSLTGDPIVKPMALAFPDNGYENIKDQFMLGDSILVAPIVQKGVYKRKVILPAGKWKGDDGKIVVGANTIEIDVPIDRLPFYKKISSR